MFDIFFPLQLDTLRGWRVLLTIVVIAGSILYALASYILTHLAQQQVRPVKKSSKKKEKTVSHPNPFAGLFQQLFAEDKKEQMSDIVEVKEESVKQVEEFIELPEAKEETLDEDNSDDVQLSGEEISSQELPRWKTLFAKKPMMVMELEEVEENISELESLGEEIEELPQEENKEILMTEETVAQIEQHNKSQIKWEEFQSELEYLKKKQKWDEYESKLIEGLAQDPEHIDILEHLADFYMMDNQQKKALPLYKKIVEKQPENHSFLWKMAQVYLFTKDFEMAEVLLDNALSLHPETPKYAMNLVEIYYRTERKDKSLTLMEDIVQRRPENLSYRNALVNLYEEFGYQEQIVDAYESMLLLDPTSVALKRKLLEARTKVN